MAVRTATPREVIFEMGKAKIRPWWFRKFQKDLTERLTRAQHNGKPLIDTPMSQAAIDAVFEEAIDVIMTPTDPIDDMIREMKAAGVN